MPEQEQNLQQKAGEILGTQDPDVKTEGIIQETAAGQGSATRQDKSQGEPTRTKIPSLRTLKGDISEYMKSRTVSLVDIAAEASKQRRFDETENQSKKFLVLTSVIILLVAGLGIGGWLVFLKESAAPETTFQPPKSLILSEKQEIITLKSESRSELISLIQKTIETPISPNSILNIPVLLETKDKKEFLQAKNFFSILGIKPPANLVQSLEGPFMLGIFYQKQNFLILKIKSFDLALSGMRDWEKNIAQDLKEIFQIQNVSPINQKFQDKIIKNRDARILYDVSGNPILVYAFVGKNYLVIAPDSDTLEEIFRRFTIGR
jgi:hypothetical protein